MGPDRIDHEGSVMTGKAAEFVTASELAALADRSLRTVQHDCATGVVEGARKVGRDWIIPAGSARAYAAREPYSALRKTGAGSPGEV